MKADTLLMDGRKLVSTRLIREEFGIGDVTVWRWVKRGLLPKPIKIGGKNFFVRNEMRLVFFAHPSDETKST